VLRETRPGERRVAAVPTTIDLLHQSGFEVVVEPGAGLAAGVSDEDYRSAGAVVDAAAADGAVALLSVGPPPVDRFARCAPGAVAISFAPMPSAADAAGPAAAAGVTWLAMERLPRISRAQSMDALTSQALVAGYRAALVAATALPRFLPMLMTAAGTVQPARVLVLGAGAAWVRPSSTSGWTRWRGAAATPGR
jgi:H+-translocating NAD(P) transhydrogenase subunit alpha